MYRKNSLFADVSLLLVVVMVFAPLYGCGGGGNVGPPPAVTTGSVKIVITNNDNSTITPKYSIDGGSWKNFQSLAPGATAEMIFGNYSAGDHQVSTNWIQPQNGQAYNKGPITQIVKAGETTVWQFTFDKYVPPPPPPPTTGIMKVRYTSTNSYAISPQYAVNGASWQNFGAVSAGAVREIDLTVAPGSYSLSSFYVDPNTGLGYTEGPISLTVYAGQTTIWDFSISQHLPPPPPPPTTGTMIIRVISNDNDIISPKFTIDNNAPVDFPTLAGFETKEQSQSINAGTYNVSLTWVDPTDGKTYNVGPVSQVVYAGLTTVWTFTIAQHDPLVAYPLEGTNFSAYMTGQNPNWSYRLTDAQIRARMKIIKPYTRRIRSFGVGLGQDNTGRIAHELGLEAWIGAWLSADLVANEAELATLIRIGQAGEADRLIIGSEVLLRGDLTSAQLIDYIRRVKAAVPGVPVIYADVYGQILAHPEVVAEIDVIMVNYYGYWEGLAVDKAIAALHGWHMEVVAAAKGKPIVVSETGWPSAGDTNGNAVPSDNNAAFYFKNFISWARANNVLYFYFEAFDEEWKRLYEGEVGAHWGLFDKDGVMKPGMQPVFDGEVMPDNWSSTAIPGGEGTPAIELVDPPPIGSNLNLQGQIWHVLPSDYKVAVYIYVSGWWIKPYFASPKTTIASDGKWICDITTGGSDQNATKIAAFLIPNSYDPPLLAGSAGFPVALTDNAVASIIYNR